MRLERQEEEEIEMLLGQIPYATSLAFHHQECDDHRCHHNHNQHHVHGHAHGHGHGHGHEHGHGFRGDDHEDYNKHKHLLHPHDMYGDDRHGGLRHHHNGIYDDDPSDRRNICASSVIASDGSSPSSFSGGLSLEEEGWSPEVLLYDFSVKLPTKKASYPNGFDYSSESKLFNSNKVIDVLGLSDKLRAVGIRDERKEESRLDSYGSPVGVNRGSAVTNGLFKDWGNGYSNWPRCPVVPKSAMQDEDSRLLMMRMQHDYQMGNVFRSSGSDGPFPNLYTVPASTNCSWKQAKEHMSNTLSSNIHFPADSSFSGFQYNRVVPVTNGTASVNRPSPNCNGFFHSHQNGSDSSEYQGMFNSINSLPVQLAKQPLLINSTGNLLHCGLPMNQNGWSSQSPPSVQTSVNFDAIEYGDSLILQAKDFSPVANYRRGVSHFDIGRQHSIDNNFRLNSDIGYCGSDPRAYCPPVLPAKHNLLSDLQSYDQRRCRFLQRKFDEGTPEDVQKIITEIINHVVELMMHPFGNYLVQKLLEVCNEDQRMQVLLVVTGKPGVLVKISLNSHGTRAVQKLIESLKTREQITLVVLALEPGFLDLIKDLNGNHVVQRCLQCLSSEDNKFIFSDAAKHCVDIATHKHGCCVLQRYIAQSTEEHRENLVAEISANGLLLAQDAFGNYVVQYILELKIPSAISTLISQFEGNYADLSTQKFSSNVVEKCLHVFGEENRSRIIHELLSTPQFDKLLQDPYANYVIQSALAVSKGPLHTSLVEAIRTYEEDLRTSPYCKRIISRTVLKK